MTDSIFEIPTVAGKAGLVRTIGEQLFGARWQTELAAALNVNDRSLRRWLSGQDTIPPGVWDDLRTLVQQRWLSLQDVEYQLNDVKQVTVHRFRRWNQQTGDFDISPIRATKTYIAKVGCEIIEGTERRVDGWSVDVEGRLIGPPTEEQTSVSNVMPTTGGFGFNLLNVHRAPLATFEYNDQKTAVRMRRLFDEVRSRAVAIATHESGR